MTVSAASDVYFDPYDVEINANPYPAFARLREESPLYYNEQYDFYALSRFADVNKALVDHETFSSARGAIVELIKANIEIPSGALIFEDPPIHDIHRKLLARMFTPRKINALEPKIRQYCAKRPRPARGHGQVRLRHRPRRRHADAGDQRAARHPRGTTRRRSATTPTRRCAPRRANPWRPPTTGSSRVEIFEAYIDWRRDNPSDDIMTELLNVEFTDEDGVDPAADPRGTAHLPQRRRGRRQRDHDATDRLGRQGVGRTPRPASRTGGEPGTHSAGHRGAAALRAARTARRPLRHSRHRVLRPDRARRQRDDDADRRRGARPVASSRPTATFSTSTASSVSTSRSASAPTTASDRHWPGWRAASRSKRSSSGSPSGMST